MKNQGIDLDEAVDLLNANVDMKNEGSLDYCEHVLKKMYLNRKLISDFILDGLKKPNEFQKDNLWTSQAVVLYRNDNFTIRSVLWKPMGKKENYLKNSAGYIYERPHCHNFNLATIGYAGSGYTTQIWQYDNSKVQGIVGEKVEISFKETKTLSLGETLKLRAGREIHTQLFPEELSISLNILGRQIITDKGPMKQFYFDVDKKVIAENFTSNIYMCALNILSEIGDENAIDFLIETKKSTSESVKKKMLSNSINRISQRII